MGRTVAVVAALAGCGLTLVGAAQAATHPKRPAVTWIEAAPQSIPATGGFVLVRAYVKNATHCELSAQHGSAAARVHVKTVVCASGRATIRAKIAPNLTTHLVGVWFHLTARNAKGVGVDRKIEVTQETKPPPPPLEIPDSTLPAGLTGAGYSATLVATGGTQPYSWSVISGALPVGVGLNGTTLVGTPTTAGPSSFTLQVTDAKGVTATASYSLPVNAPLALSTPALGESLNWSGYVLTGGPFTGVAGTFNVPSITASSVDTVTSEWLGVDGSDNTNLIQAGVTEQFTAATGSTVVYAWVEELPAPETPISMPVAIGNQVTVDISQVTQGTWNIYLKNDTTGDTYSLTESYAGAGSSAEWIVEAPTDAATMQIVSVGTFSPVTFTQLGVSPASGDLTDVTLWQDNNQLGTPSALSANGFTVAYGASAPAAP